MHAIPAHMGRTLLLVFMSPGPAQAGRWQMGRDRCRQKLFLARCVGAGGTVCCAVLCGAAEWLAAKQRRLALETKQADALSRAVSEELEWINRKAKGQQKKGAARMRRCGAYAQAAMPARKIRARRCWALGAGGSAGCGCLL